MDTKSQQSLREPRQPLLFVDVDGVISLWGFRMDACPTGDWRNVEGVPHFLSARAGAHLQGLLGLYEAWWCTGWEEKANDHLPQALGLPGPLPYVPLDRGGGNTSGMSVAGHWKLDAIDRIAGDRPLAWVDDAFNEACHDWARGRPAPTLLVATDPAVGLGDREAELLRDFGARHALDTAHGAPRAN